MQSLQDQISKIKYLTFKGGGVSGQVYPGCIEELCRHGFDLKQLSGASGASAGSIMALMVGLGFSLEEIKSELFGIDWSKWLDHKWGVFRDAHNLKEEKGWCQSDVAPTQIKKWIASKLGKEDATFIDLLRHRNFQLIVSVCNVSRGNSVEYHGLEALTMNLPLWESVYASMAIPVVFEPAQIKGDEFCDGGWVDNYPAIWPSLEINQEEWLGFWVSNPDAVEFLEERPENYKAEIDGKTYMQRRSPRRKSSGISSNGFSYILRVMKGAMEAELTNHLNNPEEVGRTVYIETEVSTLDFDIGEWEQKGMLEDGSLGVQRFFERIRAN